MRDIVSDNITNEERGEIDTNNGIYQVEPVVGVGMEATSKQGYHGIDKTMQHEGSYCRQQAHKERQDE